MWWQREFSILQHTKTQKIDNTLANEEDIFTTLTTEMLLFERMLQIKYKPIALFDQIVPGTVELQEIN